MEMESGFFFLSWVLKGGIPDRSSDSVAYWEGKLRQNLEPDLAFSMSGQMGVSSTSSCVDPEVPLTREELQLQTPLLNSTLHPVLLPGSPRHSLRYSCRRVSESSQEFPQFHCVVLLDDQPIARNRHNTSSVELLVPWMVAEEKTMLAAFRVLWANLEWLSNNNNQTEGLHTWQVILGCELGEDGSKGGFLNYSHDGKVFISFDKETLRWVAAQPQAQKITEKWNNEKRRSQRNKGYIETCIERMQKCLSYQTESLKKTDPFTSSSPTTQLPQSSSRPDPDNHPDRTPDTHHEGGVWWKPWEIWVAVVIVGAVLIVIVGVVIRFRAYCWRKLKNNNSHVVVENLPLPQINGSPSADNTEDETQSQMLPST